MNKLNRGIILLLSLIAMCMISSSVLAHTLWINVTDFTPAIGNKNIAKTKIYMGWGHHFPVDSYVKASDFNNLFIVTPTDEKRDIVLETEGFAAKELTLTNPGLHIVGAIRKEAWNTSYKENGKLVHIKGTKEGHSNIVSSIFSQQFAKSLINVGDGPQNNLSKVLGHKLEIIPLTNPYTIVNNRGGVMKVKVLFDGKPLLFNKVYAMYEGYSVDDMASSAVSTDRQGIASLRIDHWGKWVVKTKVNLPARQLLKDKVNEENYFASLTFLVP